MDDDHGKPPASEKSDEGANAEIPFERGSPHTLQELLRTLSVNENDDTFLSLSALFEALTLQEQAIAESASEEEPSPEKAQDEQPGCAAENLEATAQVDRGDESKQADGTGTCSGATRSVSPTALLHNIQEVIQGLVDSADDPDLLILSQDFLEFVAGESGDRRDSAAADSVLECAARNSDRSLEDQELHGRTPHETDSDSNDKGPTTSTEANTPSETNKTDKVETPQKAQDGKKKRGPYNKTEVVHFPRRLLEHIDPDIINQDDRLIKALEGSKKSFSREDGATRGPYKCNQCGANQTSEEHECPFVRVDRRALGEVRENFPDLPKSWQDILDLYNDLDRIRDNNPPRKQAEHSLAAEGDSSESATALETAGANDEEVASATDQGDFEPSGTDPLVVSMATDTDQDDTANEGEDQDTMDESENTEESSVKKRRVG
ncbi:expressed unknown protein [Seminavis robusta]|uniref:Uncharacterized protein n=1 Tax=Seminavis robusta TaxID=568900 RepID=A0A9N8HUE1_9STRA|nr:expressed unknown protein [Seminavis robusta]|eukprot:Sro1803_g298610.1 n/a (436) ;mRNA; r:6644-8055